MDKLSNRAIEKLGNRTVQTISGGTETHYSYGSGTSQLVRYYDMQSGVSVDHKIISYDNVGSMSELDTYDSSNNLLDSVNRDQ